MNTSESLWDDGVGTARRSNAHQTAKREPRELLFPRGPDGMVVQSEIYSPITGQAMPKLPKCVPAQLYSKVPLSDSQRLSTATVLNTTSTLKANSTWSCRELQDDRNKHLRAYDGPKQKYTSTILYSQNYAHGCGGLAVRGTSPFQIVSALILKSTMEHFSAKEAIQQNFHWLADDDGRPPPIIISQDIGWSDKVNEPRKPQFGMKCCKETRIAEHHILGPRHT